VKAIVEQRQEASMKSAPNPRALTTLRGVTRGLVLFAVFLTITAIASSSRALAASTGPSNPQRVVLAQTEAHHLLSLAILPKGSKRIGTWIKADGNQLATPMTPSGNIHQVDLTQFFLAPSGSAALAWVRAHVPKGAHLTSMGTSSGPNSGGESEVTYTFAGTSILPRPELEYSMVITPQHQLEMRIDAIVAYRPQAA
jgi:hypothetical protein